MKTTIDSDRPYSEVFINNVVLCARTHGYKSAAKYFNLRYSDVYWLVRSKGY